MKLFGRELYIEQTLEFVDSISNNKNALCHCATTECLVLQAAQDLAEEVKRLRQEVQNVS